LALKIR